MNWDLIFLVIFFLILFTIFKIFRNKFEVQSGIFALYKTKLGLNLMDKIASKYPKTLNFLANISIFIGFLGMIVTFGFLFKGALSIFSPSAQPQVAPILPGVSIAGLPTLSFWHWIISILIAATIHEFMHGVYARLNKIKIKSSGFAFLGPILAAFVEPDEKQLAAKSTKAQLSVLSAGPFSNIVLGIIILILMLFIVQPIGNNIIRIQGVEISSINETFPIVKSGITASFVMSEIENEKIDDLDKIKLVLDQHKPGDIIKIKADEKFYNVELGSNPSNKTQALLGISINNYKYDKTTLTKIFLWFSLLIFWLFNINVGIGMFNLLPLGPVDGGRMFYSIAFHFTKNKVKSLKILKFVSFFVLFLIILNMWPFILKLFSWLLKPLLSLF